MRYFFVLLCFAISFQLASQTFPKVDLGLYSWDENLKGKVKSVETARYLRGKNGPIEYQKKIDYHFDEKGTLQKALYYKYPNRVDQIWHYHYDENGKPIKTVKKAERDDEFVDFEITYFENGERTRVEEIQKGKVKYYTEFTCEGGKCQEIYWNSYGKILRGVNRKMDSNGDVVAAVRYVGPQTVSPYDRVYSYERDGTGKLTSISSSKLNGESPFWLLYDYTDDGQLAEIMNYTESLDNLVNQKKYVYNDDGDVVSYTWIGKEQTTIREYVYEYDKQGNWIRRDEYQDDYPKWIVDRKITYW